MYCQKLYNTTLASSSGNPRSPNAQWTTVSSDPSVSNPILQGILQKYVYTNLTFSFRFSAFHPKPYTGLPQLDPSPSPGRPSLKDNKAIRLDISPIICFLLLSVNCSTYLFRQRFGSRLTELQHFINLIYLDHYFLCYCYT